MSLIDVILRKNISKTNQKKRTYFLKRTCMDGAISTNKTNISLKNQVHV